MLQTTTGLFDWLYRDDQIAELFSIETHVRLWIDIEVALAEAQSALGLIDPAVAQVLAETGRDLVVDFQSLKKETLIVGYPILPLIRQFDEALPPHARGKVHLGATTQDIMDTALSIQLQRSAVVLRQRLLDWGNALSRLVVAHTLTAMVGRTHAQQAVPTTFGSKMASYLAELTRHMGRLTETSGRLGTVSLHGAAGTSAAFEGHGEALRAAVATRLNLRSTEVPWHSARDTIGEIVVLAGMMSASAVRFAREVIDLSRTEIGEVSEPTGKDRGASSTMPNKRNPITSEVCIGAGIFATSQASGALRFMEASHERAAGEWQAEWKTVPEVLAATASALSHAASVAESLDVDVEAMDKNLHRNGGLILAEAYMMDLVPALGRERARDVVYDAVARVRRNGTNLAEELTAEDGINDAVSDHWPIDPADYLGNPEVLCSAALDAWNVQAKGRQ